MLEKEYCSECGTEIDWGNDLCEECEEQEYRDEEYDDGARAADKFRDANAHQSKEWWEAFRENI